MSSPFQTQGDPYHRGSVLSRSFLPLALITLGVVFLLGNLVPERGRGGLILLGLGAAFLIGRATTGRYGYAVPAGLLLAIGAYVGLQDVQSLQSLQRGAFFFSLLGIGFALVYAIGARPAAVWPLFPATVLIGLGLLMFGVTSLSALASLRWIVSYWPIVLVLLGVWLLFRDHLPLAVRRPIATLGGLALLGYGILAAAATVSGGPLSRAGAGGPFGQPGLTDTVTLELPIAAGQLLTVNNPDGQTTIRATNDSNVHVVATRHFSFGGKGQEVRLTPTASGLTLDGGGSGGHFPFGDSNSIDYTVDVPATAQLNVQSSSGQVEIDGINGGVQASTNSGRLNLSNLAGALQAHSSSGSVEMTNIGGDVRASTTSGKINGTQLQHLREATTTSGSISLDGVFTDQARILSTGGSVDVQLSPGSAVQLDVSSGSGSVTPEGDLHLTNGVTQRNRLAGTLGSPAQGATLSINTTSGSVAVAQVAAP